jgi:hypothetical protein
MSRTGLRIKIALFNFLVASLLGAVMRYDFIREIPGFNYVNMESAHWHTALFGWIFLCMYSLLIGTFLPALKQQQTKYNVLFWGCEVLVIIDAISNMLFGYNFIAMGIDLSLLGLIGCFIYCFLKDLKEMPDSFSGRIVKLALFFLAFSFSGMVFKVPVEILFSIKKSILTYLSTQLFLHFNYNGWFTFGILALFFRLLENHGVLFSKEKFVRFKWAMFICVFFTYFLSIFWGYPGHNLFLGIASGAGVVQLAALFYVKSDFRNIFRELKSKLMPNVHRLFQLAFVAWLIKLFLQAVVMIPKIAWLALNIRNYMIAYLHLLFLGVTTLFLLGFSIQQGHIRTRGFLGNSGVRCLALGFILMELILVFQGTFLWMGLGYFTGYYVCLFGITLLLPLGLTCLLLTGKAIDNPESIQLPAL